jgi:tRNA(fMet)-specific endonuclease VapC
VAALDVLIASVALLYDLTVVTHNTRDFERIPGLRVADWLAP